MTYEDDFEVDDSEERYSLVTLARMHLGTTGVIPSDLYMALMDEGYFPEFVDALDPEYPANENPRFSIVRFDDGGEYPPHNN